jgi:hypothetical protein
LTPHAYWADGNAIHLSVDRRQTLSATDYSGRKALLSPGTALDHLRVAMTAAHGRTGIARLPTSNNQGHLATVEFSPIDHVTSPQPNRAGDPAPATGSTSV